MLSVTHKKREILKKADKQTDNENTGCWKILRISKQ